MDYDKLLHLLRQMKENVCAMYKICADNYGPDDSRTAAELTEFCTLNNVISLIENPEYFGKIWDIYCTDDDVAPEDGGAD